MRPLYPLLCLFFAYQVHAVDPQHGLHVDVTIGPHGEAGEALATIRIHAARRVVWHLLTSCTEAVKIVPGLKSCVVQETAADRSWQIIRQVMAYSWLLPRVSYMVKASYSRPDRIVFEKTAGDLITLRGSWDLQADGDETVARYIVDFQPDTWVPGWFVRATLRSDLPKMLRALRANAEAAG